jgi:O-antigen ligase
MGFILALFYLAVTYIGTKTIFGPLQQYHIEVILAALVFFVSIPALQRTFVQKTAQTLALGGLSIAVFMSMLIGKRYAHGALTQFEDFLPNAFAYFLVALHFRTKLRLQILVLLLVFVCLFVTANGVLELHSLGGFQPQHPDDDDELEDTGPLVQIQDPYANTYLIPQWNPDGTMVYRLKGQNFLNDPNDFGQLLVSTLPLAFIFWRPKRTAGNLLIVLPIMTLIGLGIYMTHSRGALLAVLGVVIVAFRRRIGTVPSFVLAGILFAGAMAMGATGGRGISASAGQDRTALWGEGLGLFKQNPIFGAGYNQMADLLGMTAHNSVIVCAAELGVFGLFFWSLFLYSTLRDAAAVASPTGLTDEIPLPVDESPYSYNAPAMEPLDKEEIGQMGRLIVFSLAGFLVSAMFLSRAFVMTFFLLGGMAEVVFQMALDRGMIGPRLPIGRVAAYSSVLALFLVPGMYVIVRVLNLAH